MSYRQHLAEHDRRTALARQHLAEHFASGGRRDGLSPAPAPNAPGTVVPNKTLSGIDAVSERFISGVPSHGTLRGIRR